MSLKDSGVKEDELQAILNYLLTMHEVILEFHILGFELLSFIMKFYFFHSYGV
jgi:hypothetical protein